jgi:arylsulfatase A-like enzyme
MIRRNVRQVAFNKAALSGPLFFFGLLLCLTSPGACGRPDTSSDSETEDARNVILITIDTLRADRLGCTGHRGAATPVLDALAREGVLFDHVIAPVPITLPSHAALMTGRLPHEMGLRDNRPYALSEEARTLAEALSNTGYRTLAIVSGEPLMPGCGLEQGFDRYLFRPDTRRAGVLLKESPADRTVDLTLSAADGLNADWPFFMWVHFFDPHVPYAAPGAFDGGGETAAGRDPYDAEVSFADREIGRMLEGLSRRGMMKDTLLVITSDHGEGLGDHGEPTHAYFLFDSTLRVPLIVKGPGIPGGRYTRAQVRLRDLPGAILALLKHPGTDITQESQVLADFLTSSDAVPPRSRPAFAESLFCHDHFGWAQLTAIRTDRYKVVRGARTEVFDLESDRIESDPRPPGRMNEEARRLVELLDERVANARSPSAQQRLLPGSLPGYFGGTTGGERLFVPQERNAALPHPPDRTDALNRFLRAVELNQSGMLNRALTLLDELAQEDPRNPSILFWLGRTERALGEKEGNSAMLERALAHFNAAHRIDAGFGEALHMSVWCLLQLGRFMDAEEVIKSRLESHPDDAGAWELSGFLYTTRDSNGRTNPLFHIEKGLERFEVSLRKNQNNPRLLQKLVALYKSLGRTELENKRRRQLEDLEAQR